MSIGHVKHIVVGAGGAGSAAAEAIRKHDPQGSILLIGQESTRPYLRPSLSKEYLRRQMSKMDIVIEPVGWYDANHIELRTGRRVTHLDTARRTIALDNGDEIAFDNLLLATGASARPLKVPGADLPNVFYLRTISDCDRLHNAIDKAKSEGRQQPGSDRSIRGRAAVIGADLLAVESAASLRQMGLHVDLIVGPSHAWSRIAGENTGKFIARFLEKHGVAVHANIDIARIEGDGRVQRIALSEGTPLDCDFAVAAEGIVPNRELVRDTPIAAEKAILVDDHCRTNVAGIYAAGDCAAVFDSLYGKHRLLDHWESARYTGAIAGANMAGADVRYDTVNTFTSDIFELKLFAWGEARFVDRRLVRGTPAIDSPAFAEIGVASDGRVSQVLAIGRPEEHELFNELVRRRFNVEGHEEAIKDPSRDLRELLG